VAWHAPRATDPAFVARVVEISPYDCIGDVLRANIIANNFPDVNPDMPGLNGGLSLFDIFVLRGGLQSNETRWSEAASEDLESIFEYIAKDSPAEAANQIEAIFAAGERLAQFPLMGRAGRVSSTRGWVIPPFIIIYMIEGDVLHVLHVIHGSQDYRFLIQKKKRAP
jgi:toxin ParE1/3/4